MSTRYNNGSHYENHQRAAELHDLAAHAHRSAAEQRGKQDHLTGGEHSRQALEHSRAAHERSIQSQPHGVVTFGEKEIERVHMKSGRPEVARKVHRKRTGFAPRKN